MADIRFTEAVSPTEGQDKSQATQAPTKTDEAQAPAQPTGQPTDLGGFKSVDELKNAYQELRSWNTRLSQEMSQLKQYAQPQPQQQRPTSQDILNRLVQEPDVVLGAVKEAAVEEAYGRMALSNSLGEVINRARAAHPDIVTPENEAILASYARQAPVTSGDPIQAAEERMKYAVDQFRVFVGRIRETGIKQGENSVSMKAQAGFETGSAQVKSNPGLTLDVVKKLMYENPAEYERLWRENPQAMQEAFKR